MQSRFFAARWAGALLLAPSASSLPAQLIAPKTVPIHQSEQFGIYPSQWPGMGGVSIALVDTLGDPWSNPAKAARLTVGSLQVMPFAHRATAGSGRTISLSLLQTGRSIAGGALFSLQELERSNVAWNVPISDRRASNQYVAGILARRFGNGLSIGGGVNLATLRGVDGVGALYAGSDLVRQDGSQVDARLGLTKDFSGGSTLEVVAVSYWYDMTHDVHYPSFQRWACPPCVPGGPCTCNLDTVPERDEHNQDRTSIGGLHAVFLTPRTTGGWRTGYLFTANRMSHPKIPNYQIQNIPRDPGNTDAFNFGFGAAREFGRSTFGLDVIVEPMWSETWADAAGDTTDVHGVVLPRGAHTVDNDFRFSNHRINLGFSQDIAGSSDSGSVLSLQFGLSMRTINYTLDQGNHVQRWSRSQSEGWTEWTPTFGIRVRGRNVDFSYGVSTTCGPSCSPLGRGDDVSVTAPPPPSVLAAPSAPLTFDGGSSKQHRVMVSIRLR